MLRRIGIDLRAVRKDRNGREMPAAALAFIAEVSLISILRMLKRRKFRPCKVTKKPGLTPAIKEARYQMALRFKDWTLEDWKNVIFSDETSVILGYQRGKVRV